MNKLTIELIAFPEASKDIIIRGEEILKNKLTDFDIDISDQNPDALFIITGGSENHAKKVLKNKKHILILAMTESNSYAAATEIKAYCNQNKIDSVLYNIDNETYLSTKLNYYLKCIKALNKIKKYKVGLIGEVSEWLIASNIDKEKLNNKFGIQLEKVSWNDFPKYSGYDINKEFLGHFKSNGFNLEDSSKVYNLLKDITIQKEFDAITTECFPLVRENAVTACLALSKLNTEGLASGCEGDITSITGKIVVKELTGQIPWMANIAGIDNDHVFFAHCTIATDLVSEYKINTHYETNEGTAVQGKFKSESATVFRLSNELNKAFISFGRIIERPEREDSCRTQIKIELPKEDILKLKENPLGNHHLILPSNQSKLLEYFCKLTGIKII